MHLVAVIAVAVPLRQTHDHTQRTATRNDGGLVDRIGCRLVDRDDGMAGLMIGGHLLLIVGHDHGAALRSHHDLVLGILELLHCNEALGAARGQQGGFVDQIGQIRTGETGRTARNRAAIDIGRQRQLLHMHAQDLLTALDIGTRDDDLTIETAGTQQGRIEHIGAVGRRNDDDAFIGLETIHLHQQLVQRLLALVIAVADACAAMATDGVDFIDEQNAGRVLLRLLEHIPDPGRADADEHFHEIGAGDGEERHACLTRNGAGEQGLAGAGRADQQRTLGNLAAQLGEFGRVLQKFDDFFQLLARFIDAGDVLKRYLAVLFGEQLGLGLAKAHRAAGAAAFLHLSQHEKSDADDQDEGKRLHQQILPDARLILRHAAGFHAIGFQKLVQAGVVRDRNGLKLGVVGIGADDSLGTDLDAFYRARGHLLAERGIADPVRIGGAATIENREYEEHGQDRTCPDHHALHPGIALRLLIVVHILLQSNRLNVRRRW